MIQISSKYQLQIEKLRRDLKNDPITQNLFSEYQVPISELDSIPMFFAQFPVSARTEHGIIYFNLELIEENNEPNQEKWRSNYHYAHHELTHYLQQTTGIGPTKGSDEDSYLDNEFEQEGFQEQTKFISHHEGEEKAENYIEQVLDHHDVDGEERKEKKKDLLHFASNKKKQLGFDFSQPETSLDSNDLENILEQIERGKNKPPKPNIFQLEPQQKNEVLQRLQELRKAIHEEDWDSKPIIPRKIAQNSELDCEIAISKSAYKYKLKMFQSLMDITSDSVRQQILNQVMNDYFEHAYSIKNESLMRKIEKFISTIDQANFNTLPLSQLRRVLRVKDISELQEIVFSKTSETNIVNLYSTESEQEKNILRQILKSINREVPGIK